MLFKVKFQMLPNVTPQQVQEKAMAWEREEKETPPNYKTLGKFGYYGARSGFYLITATSADTFYPMVKWFSDIFLWEVKPIHKLDDFYNKLQQQSTEE